MAEWLVFIRECRVASKQFNRGLAENVFVTATSHANRATALEDADRRMSFYEFLEGICRCAYFRENYSARRHVPLPECVRLMLEECVLPNAQRDSAHEVRALLESDEGVRKAFSVYGEALHALHSQLVSAKHTHMSTGKATVTMGQFLDLLSERGVIGSTDVRQLSEVRTPKHSLKMYRATLTVPRAKRCFVDSQRAEERPVGSFEGEHHVSTELDYEEFLECVGRCGLLKYEGVEQMTLADRVTAIVLNVLGRMDVASVVTAATLVRAQSSFDPRRDSRPLEGEGEEELAAWVDCWSLMDLSDIRDHPEFNGPVFELLHQAFRDLRLIFSFYCKTLGAETARDAELMDMAEWLVFIRECRVASKQFNRGLAENVFVTATSHANRATALEDADRRMSFYEFLEGICRCAYFRENYSARRHVPLPECVRLMLEECVLPNAQRDSAHEVRALLESDEGVRKAFSVYGEALHALHSQLVSAKHTHMSTGKATVTMGQFLDLLSERGVIGSTDVRQLSEVRTPKHSLKMYRATLTVPRAKRCFVDSQRAEERPVGSFEGEHHVSTELDYEEFLECVGRCGLLKYEGVEQMTLADRVTAIVLNVLGRMDVASVVTAATLVRAWTSFTASSDSRPLPGESEQEHLLWLGIWAEVERSLTDLHGFPLWLKDVHNMLQAAHTELRELYSRLLRQGGEFGVDSATWAHFASAAPLKEAAGATEEDLRDAAALSFQHACSSVDLPHRLELPQFIAALPRLAFAAFNPHFGDPRRSLEGSGDKAKIRPVPLALLGLLDAMSISAIGTQGAVLARVSPTSPKARSPRAAPRPADRDARALPASKGRRHSFSGLLNMAVGRSPRTS